MDVYDPVLGEDERAMLRARGCGVPERNEEGRRSVAAAEAEGAEGEGVEGVEGVTLFFMPHCGRQLYANVLEVCPVGLGLGLGLGLGYAQLATSCTPTCSRRTGARSSSPGWPYWATRSPRTLTRSPRRSASARPAGAAA